MHCLGFSGVTPSQHHLTLTCLLPHIWQSNWGGEVEGEDFVYVIHGIALNLGVETSAFPFFCDMLPWSSVTCLLYNTLTNSRQDNKCLLEYVGYMFQPVNRSLSGLQQSKSQVLFWILVSQYLHLLTYIKYDIQFNSIYFAFIWSIGICDRRIWNLSIQK